jgi:hypothetical protein
VTGRIPTRLKPAYQRYLKRIAWARSHGFKGYGAKFIGSNITRFRDYAASVGVDPDTLGDFGRAMHQLQSSTFRQGAKP